MANRQTWTDSVPSKCALPHSPSDKPVHTHSRLGVLTYARMESRECGKFALKFLSTSHCGQVLRQPVSAVNSDLFPMWRSSQPPRTEQMQKPLHWLFRSCPTLVGPWAGDQALESLVDIIFCQNEFHPKTVYLVSVFFSPTI